MLLAARRQHNESLRCSRKHAGTHLRVISKKHLGVWFCDFHMVKLPKIQFHCEPFGVKAVFEFGYSPENQSRVHLNYSRGESTLLYG